MITKLLLMSYLSTKDRQTRFKYSAKLEVDDCTQAVVFAFKHHLVPQDDE